MGSGDGRGTGGPEVSVRREETNQESTVSQASARTASPAQMPGNGRASSEMHQAVHVLAPWAASCRHLSARPRVKYLPLIQPTRFLKIPAAARNAERNIQRLGLERVPALSSATTKQRFPDSGLPKIDSDKSST